jgi:ribosomal protein S18 acetylase RimI-like enzyme
MMPIRAATNDEIDALVSLINRAFVVERFFLEGERTVAEQVATRMQTGTFLVAQDAALPQQIAGTVYVERRPFERAYIGLLAVEPSIQRAGLGRHLMRAAEDHAAQLGSRTTELTVVNLRTELFPFYESLGYTVTGQEPFPNASTRPCHLVVMSKALT